MNTIHFFKEGIHFRLNHQDELRKWIRAVVIHYKFQLNEINFIFCTDPYLLQLNKKFLNHHYFTDVITFDNSIKKKSVSADIFISYPRVTENAARLKVNRKDELHRVMIHGVLHLLGFKDKTGKESFKMKKTEDSWLLKRKF